MEPSARSSLTEDDRARIAELLAGEQVRTLERLEELRREHLGVERLMARPAVTTCVGCASRAR